MRGVTHDERPTLGHIPILSARLATVLWIIISAGVVNGIIIEVRASDNLPKTPLPQQAQSQLLQPPVFDFLYIRRVLAENEYPLIGAGVVGDANLDGVLNIADACYLQNLNRFEHLSEINGFTSDGHLIIGDTTPRWGRPVLGQSDKMSSEINVLNLSDTELVFRYCFGRENGNEGTWRNPIVRAREQRTLHNLIENVTGVSGEVKSRIGVVCFDVRHVDGSEPSADQLSKVFINGAITLNGRSMTITPVTISQFNTGVSNTIIPLPKDVDNQELMLCLPNPGMDNTVTHIDLRGYTGNLLGSREYTTPGFGVILIDPFSDFGVDPRDYDQEFQTFYLHCYPITGYFIVIPNLILTEVNSGSITTIPARKPFVSEQTHAYLPYMVRGGMEINGQQVVLTTDALFNFYSDNFPWAGPGLRFDSLDFNTFQTFYYQMMGCSGCNYYFEDTIFNNYWLENHSGVCFTGPYTWGRTCWEIIHVQDADGTEALTCIPGTVQEESISGSWESILLGLDSDTTNRTDLRIVNTSTAYTPGGENTLHVGVDVFDEHGIFLGRLKRELNLYTSDTIEDIYDQFAVNPVHGGFARVYIANQIMSHQSIQPFAIKWDTSGNRVNLSWTPGQNYNHGENHAPNLTCMNYLNAEVDICDRNGDMVIDEFLSFSSTGSDKKFILLGSDPDGDSLSYTFSSVSEGMPDGVTMTSDGHLTITPLQKYAGQQFMLEFIAHDGVSQTPLLFTYRIN